MVTVSWEAAVGAALCKRLPPAHADFPGAASDKPCMYGIICGRSSFVTFAAGYTVFEGTEGGRGGRERERDRDRDRERQR